MRLNAHAFLIVWLPALAVAGCSGGGEPTGTTELPGCTGPVTMSVTAGTAPTFSWTPACKVYYLDVGVEATGEEAWAIANSNNQNTIAPGVRFGIVPPGSTRIDGPAPLRAGTKYYVFVAFYNNGAEVDGGRVTFTP